MFYISKVYLNYSRDEFFDATFSEIVDMWDMYKNDFASNVKETDSINATNIEDFPL